MQKKKVLKLPALRKSALKRIISLKKRKKEKRPATTAVPDGFPVGTADEEAQNVSFFF